MVSPNAANGIALGAPALTKRELGVPDRHWKIDQSVWVLAMAATEMRHIAEHESLISPGTSSHGEAA